MGLPDEDDPGDPPGVCGDGVATAGEECDDGNASDGDSCSSTCKVVEQYTVHWRTSSVSGAAHSCPAGFDLADVIVQPVVATDGCFPQLSDCSFTLDGPELVFTAECADGAARVQAAPPSAYSHEASRVSVRFASSTTGEVYGQTLPTWLREVTDVTIFEDSGFARVTWDLRSSTGEPLDCQMADVGEVTVRITDIEGILIPITMTVPCAQLGTFTPPLVASVYTIELITWRAATTATGITIGRRSAITDPGPIVLTMPAT